MATKKTTEGEDEYFARIEKQKKDELREKLEAEEKKKAGEKAAPKGSMRCPKCDTRLETVTYKSVEIDRCENCNGIFLDDGELETLAAAPNSGGFFRGFLKSLKKGN